jgi:hypothetical protein
MSIYAKGPRGKADRLFSLVVRARGACQRCGKAESLQCAHIVSRRYNNTRTDERNAWCLCAGCHLFLTEHPEEHVWFAQATIGDKVYEELRLLARSDRKWKEADWRDEIIRLQERLTLAS